MLVENPALHKVLDALTIPDILKKIIEDKYIYLLLFAVTCIIQFGV